MPTHAAPDTSLKVFAACVHGACDRLIMVDFKDRSHVKFAQKLSPQTRAIIMASECPRHDRRQHNAVRWLEGTHDIDMYSGYSPSEVCDTRSLPNPAIWQYHEARADAVMGENVPILTPEMAMTARHYDFADPTESLLYGLDMVAVSGAAVFIDMSDIASAGGLDFLLYSVDANPQSAPMMVPGSPNEGLLSRLTVDYRSFNYDWWHWVFVRSGGVWHKGQDGPPEDWVSQPCEGTLLYS